MSTAFYKLKSPFTSILVEEGDGPHATIGIFVNHVKSGTLTVLKNELKEVIWGLVDDDCPAFVRRSDEITCYIFNLAEHYTLVSEYGSLHTVGELMQEMYKKEST